MIDVAEVVLVSVAAAVLGYRVSVLVTGALTVLVTGNSKCDYIVNSSSDCD